MVNWTPHADAKLLCAILKLHNITLNYPAIIEDFGEGLTQSAIIHRVNRLKTIAKQTPESAEGTGAGDSTGTSETPKKRGVKGEKKGGSAPKKAKVTNTAGRQKKSRGKGKETPDNDKETEGVDKVKPGDVSEEPESEIDNGENKAEGNGDDGNTGDS